MLKPKGTMLKLTETAIHRLHWIAERNNSKYCRLSVKGGGCAGFEYEWGTYKSPEELLDDDEIIKTDNGYTFVIGNASMMFLFGTIIDYKKDIIGSMFDIQNPNAKSSCGCGISVNFDMDKLSMPA